MNNNKIMNNNNKRTNSNDKKEVNAINASVLLQKQKLPKYRIKNKHINADKIID